MGSVHPEDEREVAAGTVPPPPVASQPDSTPRHGVAHPGGRTLVLAGVLALAAAGLLSEIDLWSAGPDGGGLRWWWVAVLAIAAELMAFDLEFRKQAYTFSFGEVPLVLGLFFATPGDLVLGRLVGAALLLGLKERQSALKLSFNLASFAAECATLLTVYRVIGGGRGIEDPRAWLLALAAVAAADLLGILVVAKVVRWHGGALLLRSILVVGAVTAPVNTSLALAAGLLYSANPWATLLLVGVAAFLVLSYRSYSSLSQRYQSLSMLYDVTRLVSSSQDAEEVLEGVLVQAKDLLRAERAEVWLHDERGDDLALGVDDAGRTQRHLAEGAFAAIQRWFADERAAFLVTASDESDLCREIRDAFGARDAIVAPITESGAVVGVLVVIDRLAEDKGFGKADVQTFGTLTNHTSVALENGRLLTRLHVQALEREHDSLHDALTGLANRVQFDALVRTAAAEHRDGIVAVAVMDLDGFKEINDTLGHPSGDLVLLEVAERLRRTADGSVRAARLGGDEFALLFPAPSSKQAVELFLRTVRREISAPVQVSGLRINIGASIGVALAPEHGTDGAVLLQRADVAMHGAKGGLGDGVHFYHPDTDTNSTRRLMLANDLRDAVGNGELSLAYQPKVRVADATVAGFEALLRWTHPRLGPVGPDEFIVLAERTGSIQQITQYVLSTALREAAGWQRSGRRWSVAVNLSTRNLLDDDLAAGVGRLLDETGADPQLVTLEITETSVMADADRAIAVLGQLADLGVRLSIDDFGTGYSSLSYLQRLPVDEVKIDKSFVMPMASDPSADSIVRSVLDLARNMDLTVVAEGVEDLATWHRLQTLRCSHAQGYFLSRPMPSHAIIDWAEQLPARGLGPVVTAAA